MGKLVKLVDDFYPYPELIREIALRSSYHMPKGLYGFRSTKGFLPPGTLERIQAQFGFEKVELFDVKTRSTCFYHALARGKERVNFFAHVDAVRNPESPPYAFLVYLTPNAPKNTGTGLYRHKKTGIWQEATPADAQRLNLSLKKVHAWLEADAEERSQWELIDRCENVYNRAVLFPAHWYHSSFRHFGSRVDNGRLYHQYFFRGYPDVFKGIEPQGV
jgi:hypothetical protein